ncbi:LiaG family protein [Heyndrickxia sp. NPDC080065]|uniref:LiaG family protein n=1 Tax=Heyndrickxia sp. NPDC080065 TaxID=3390568 RepID=UPI003CFCBE4F
MKKLLLFLLVLVCLYFIGMNLKSASWFPFGNKEAQSESMKNIKTIDVDISSQDVKIIPENREDLQAKLEGKGKLIVNRSGDTVHIKVKRKWFEGIRFWSKSGLKIYIPKDYDQNVDLTLGSGRIRMSGPSKDHPMKLKDVNVDMGSGLMELENLDVLRFQHKGSSGKASFHALAAKIGTIKMGSGVVDVSGYKGKLETKLSSGKLDIQMDELNDSVDIKVNSGLVKLELPKEADFTLNGTVGSGWISCDLPLKSRESGNHKVNGIHGTGEHQINVKVSSGKVDID